MPGFIITSINAEQSGNGHKVSLALCIQEIVASNLGFLCQVIFECTIPFTSTLLN